MACKWVYNDIYIYNLSYRSYFIPFTIVKGHSCTYIDTHIDIISFLPPTARNASWLWAAGQIRRNTRRFAAASLKPAHLMGEICTFVTLIPKDIYMCIYIYNLI